MTRAFPDDRSRRTTTCVSENDLCRPGRDRFEGPVKRAVEVGRNRVIVAGALFALGFAAIAGRMIDLGVFQESGEPRLADTLAGARHARGPVRDRANIVDRNGVILATSLATASLYADPRQVRDARDAAAKLARVLPEIDAKEITERLAEDRHFVWLRRDLTPLQQVAVNRLGIPGLYFQRSERRAYPHGRLAGHVLGFTNIESEGLAGVERFFNTRLKTRAGESVRLSLDIRAQQILHSEIATAVDEQKAKGGSGLIMDVDSGEILAMVSMPDFDPNEAGKTAPDRLFNRNTLGVYEMGSTFKIFTTAMALDAGAVNIDDRYDVGVPLKVARYTINDFHAARERLSVADIFIRSSNIGAARMALDVGAVGQRDFLARLGLFDKPAIELPEVGAPLRPKVWRQSSTMTVAFGHGVAVSPVQLAAGVAAVANGGTYRAPTLLRQPDREETAGRRVLSASTSRHLRDLMHRVVREGTGRNAAVPGYEIGGKTGTAEKPGRRGYDRNRLLSSFVGVFPAEKPRYVVLAIIDEPKGIDGNSRRRTGGWVAAPVVGRVVQRAGFILGVPPADAQPDIAAPPAPPVIRVSAGGNGIAAR